MGPSHFSYSKEPFDKARYTTNFDKFYSLFARTYNLLVKWVPLYRHWLDLTIPYLKGPRVLEISFGTGYLMTQFAGRFKTYGIDYNTTMMGITKRKLDRSGLTASLQRADVNHLPYANGSIDSIVNTMAFSGYPDGRRALAEMVRVLKPGGRVVMIDINYPQDRNWAGMMLARFIVATGDIIRDMPALFKAAGLTCLEQKEIGGSRSIYLYSAEKS